MTILNKTIMLSDHFKSTSLITRQAARDIFELISTLSETDIVLDFHNIEFATRSFFDEYHSNERKFKLLGKKVNFLNMNEGLSKLYDFVIKQSKSTSSSYDFASVANAKVITM